MAWPNTEGSGDCPVIDVVVVAGLTVCPTPVDVLAE